MEDDSIAIGSNTPKAPQDPEPSLRELVGQLGPHRRSTPVWIHPWRGGVPEWVAAIAVPFAVAVVRFRQVDAP